MKKKVSKFSVFITTLLLMSLSSMTTVSASIGKDIYNGTSNNILADKIEQIVRIVAGVGGILFTLAILIITIAIFFGSIQSDKASTYWKALIGCILAAFVFYSAYAFAPSIASLAQ